MTINEIMHEDAYRKIYIAARGSGKYNWVEAVKVKDHKHSHDKLGWYRDFDRKRRLDV